MKETISFPAQAGTLQSTIDWKRVINFFCNGIAHSKKSPYICNVVQLMQASVSPTTAVGIFYVNAENYNNSSVPCGVLMHPLPALGVRQRGAELFPSPEINKFNVSFQSRTK